MKPDKVSFVISEMLLMGGVLMSNQKRTRTGTRRTTMAVLQILKNSTSAGSPVSVVPLVKRLKAE